METLQMANYWLDNPELTLAAEKLWASGMGGGHVIATLKMTCTRNALMGHMHREKLQRRASKGGQLSHIGPSKPRAPPKVKLNIVPREHISHAHRERILEMELIDESSTHKTHLSVILKGQCRWVMGQPVDGYFCGSPVKSGSTNEWCPYHHKLG